jgi:glycosyltransferase involved in cell wall biosynthesis
MPLISVVMPARNAAATLAATLDSLVAQTFKDFELVLVNDASSDDTPHIAESYCSRLSIRLVHHAENQGVAKSINEGLAQSDSIFVARLDADDLARADRLEKQLAFMTAHEAVDVCGSHMEVFSEEEGSQMASFVLAHPTSHAAITTAFVQRCAMAHPSVLARRRLFDEIGAYDPRFDFAEDYELWCRAALLGRQLANIAEPLPPPRRAGEPPEGAAAVQPRHRDQAQVPHRLARRRRAGASGRVLVLVYPVCLARCGAGRDHREHACDAATGPALARSG